MEITGRIEIEEKKRANTPENTSGYDVNIDLVEVKVTGDSPVEIANQLIDHLRVFSGREVKATDRRHDAGTHSTFSVAFSQDLVQYIEKAAAGEGMNVFNWLRYLVESHREMVRASHDLPRQKMGGVRDSSDPSAP